MHTFRQTYELGEGINVIGEGREIAAIQPQPSEVGHLTCFVFNLSILAK